MEGGEDENIGGRQFKAGHRRIQRLGGVVQRLGGVISTHAYAETAFAFIVMIIKRNDLRQSCPQTEHSLSPLVHQEASPATGYNRSQDSQHHTSACTTGHIKDSLLLTQLLNEANEFHTYRRKNTTFNRSSKTPAKTKGERTKCSEDTRNSQHELHFGLHCRRRVITSQN